MNSSEITFAQRARALYLEAERHLDAPTSSALRASRRQALESLLTPARPLRLLLPTGAFAMIALVAILVWQPLQHEPARYATPAVSVAHEAHAADSDGYLPPDPDNNDPRLYSNLDFYGWLASDAGDHSQAALPQ